jgi:hypothetical protein
MPDNEPQRPAPEPLAAGTPAEPVSGERRGRAPLLADPAAIFIAAATLFAIFINSANVGIILMLGVIALLLELRTRPKG